MNLHRLTRPARRLQRTIQSLKGTNVYYITDQANWIFSWIGYYIAAYLEEHSQMSGQIIDEPLGLRNQLVHFIDRYAYLNGLFQHLHPSNAVFLNWFHGDSTDIDPAMQRLFETLIQSVPRLQKIVVSYQAAKQTLINHGIPATKLALIPLGVDLSLFSPVTGEARSKIRAELDIPDNAICIGSFQKDGVGWGEGNEPKLIKGPDIFLHVVAGLSRHYNNLMILLTGPSRGYVKQGLDKLGIPYIHRFLDNYYDIVPYYHALDLYLIPARLEGGPATLLESWATGVPLVSTNTGMPSDLVKHRQNGMIASVEDVGHLIECVTEMIEDHSLRRQCCRQALDEVQQYDWSIIAGRYYRELYQPFLM